MILTKESMRQRCNRTKIQINVLIGLSNKVYTLIIDKDIPETKGIYFVQDDSQKIIYVGQTTDFRRRIVEHFRSHVWFKRLARGAILIKMDSSSQQHLRRMELYYISIYRPKFNLEDGDIYYLTEIMGDLKEDTTERTNIQQTTSPYMEFKWEQEMSEAMKNKPNV